MQAATIAQEPTRSTSGSRRHVRQLRVGVMIRSSTSKDTMNTKNVRKSNRPKSIKKVPEASALTQKYAATILAPLGRKEAAAATKLALEIVLRDGNVKRDRVRIYGPSLRIEKPNRRNAAPLRLILVRIRDRDRGVVHDMSIKSGRIIEHLIDADANPPFSAEEQSDGIRLISADPQLGKLLASKRCEIEWFSAGEHGGKRVLGARIVRVRDHRVMEIITEVEVELDEGVLHTEGGHR
jgi:hypothetical protein